MTTAVVAKGPLCWVCGRPAIKAEMGTPPPLPAWLVSGRRFVNFVERWWCDGHWPYDSTGVIVWVAGLRHVAV